MRIFAQCRIKWASEMQLEGLRIRKRVRDYEYEREYGFCSLQEVYCIPFPNLMHILGIVRESEIVVKSSGTSTFEDTRVGMRLAKNRVLNLMSSNQHVAQQSRGDAYWKRI